MLVGLILRVLEQQPKVVSVFGKRVRVKDLKSLVERLLTFLILVSAFMG